MTLSYSDLIAIWILSGTLGAGFYVAYAKEVADRKGLSRRQRRKFLTWMLVVSTVLGPLGLIVSIVEMCRRKTWYGWALW